MQSTSNTQRVSIEWYQGAKRVALTLDDIGIGTLVYFEGLSEGPSRYGIISSVREGTGHFELKRLPDLRDLTQVFGPANGQMPDLFMRVARMPEVELFLQQQGEGLTIQGCLTAVSKPRLCVRIEPHGGQWRATLDGSTVHASGITRETALGHLVAENPTLFLVNVIT